MNNSSNEMEDSKDSIQSPVEEAPVDTRELLRRIDALEKRAAEADEENRKRTNMGNLILFITSCVTSIAIRAINAFLYPHSH